MTAYTSSGCSHQHHKYSCPHTTSQSSPALLVCLQPDCFLFPASSFWCRSSVSSTAFHKGHPHPESSLNFPHQNAFSHPSKLPSAADHLCLLCCDHLVLMSCTLASWSVSSFEDRDGPLAVSTVHCLAPCLICNMFSINIYKSEVDLFSLKNFPFCFREHSFLEILFTESSPSHILCTKLIRLSSTQNICMLTLFV